MAAVRFSSLPQCTMYSSSPKCIKPACVFRASPHSHSSPQAPNIGVIPLYTEVNGQPRISPRMPLSKDPSLQFPGWLANRCFTIWPLHMEAKERPKKETDYFRLVGGTINNQGNLHMRLVDLLTCLPKS